MHAAEISPPSVSLSAIDNAEVAACLQRPDWLAAIQKCNDQYYSWAEWRRRPLPTGADAATLWQVARLLRQQSAWTVALAAGKQRWLFSYNVPKPTSRLLLELDAQLGGERSTAQSLLSGYERSHLLVNARMEEAIASSQMEGASTTREAAKELLRTRRRPLNISERMIVNNYRTMRHLQTILHSPLTVEVLLELQALVTQGTLDNVAHCGQLRTNDEIFVVDHTTSEAVYHPTGHVYLPALLQQYCDLANAAQPTHHPLVMASLLHFLLGFLHPFADGNGRTARAIFYWYLLRRNYWLVEYMPLSRIIKRSAGQYSRAYLLTEADSNDTTYFIKYQLNVLSQAYTDLQTYLNSQRQHQAQTRQLLRTGQFNERQAQLVQWLTDRANSMLTIRDVEHRFGVVYQTARTDLMGLEALGLLEKRRVGQQKLLYHRPDDFEEKLASLR